MYGKKTFIAFKPDIDTRGQNNQIKSRVGVKIPATCISSCISEEVFNQIIKLSAKKDIVAFDEAQFFDNGILRVINELSFTYRKHVVLDGLSLTAEGKTFGCMGDILSMADEIVKVYAYCAKCGSPYATFSQRVAKRSVPSASEQVVLIGSDEYEPRCRNCFEKR